MIKNTKGFTRAVSKKMHGFTLIELLVVIAIIGLLATIAVVALSSARKSSRDTKRIGDVKQVQTGLELYYNANSSYPTCTDDTIVSKLSTAVECKDSGGLGLLAYLTGLANINDPVGGGSSTNNCAKKDKCLSGCDYGYNGYVSPSSDNYGLYFFLEDKAGSLLAGCNQATSSGITKKDPE